MTSKSEMKRIATVMSPQQVADMLTESDQLVAKLSMELADVSAERDRYRNTLEIIGHAKVMGNGCLQELARSALVAVAPDAPDWGLRASKRIGDACESAPVSPQADSIPTETDQCLK